MKIQEIKTFKDLSSVYDSIMTDEYMKTTRSLQNVLLKRNQSGFMYGCNIKKNKSGSFQILADYSKCDDEGYSVMNLMMAWIEYENLEESLSEFFFEDYTIVIVTT